MSTVAERPRYGLHATLFALTFASMMYVGRADDDPHVFGGWRFAVPLLSILVVHELGHFVASRIHRLDVSLPYFIPFPLSMLGTLGAVITMRNTPKTRNALFDVGASGPIAGLCIALPVLYFGLRWSTVEPIPPHGADEGQSLLYLAMKRIAVGPIPATHDVFLHPTAFAGWAGLLMTMLNLIPVGQLDGGHVAYALLGPRADALSARLRHGLLAVAVVAGGYAVVRAHAFGARWAEAWKAFGFAAIWVIYWVLLGWLTSEGPADDEAPQRRDLVGAIRAALFGPRAPHPPTDDAALSPWRAAVAVVTLALFFAMFTPIPMSDH
jgi:membrane-associated protease RseP (regulator of RpoE activity)